MPWRFFLAADEERAEAMLQAAGARWVLVMDNFPRNLATAAARLGLDQDAAATEGRLWRRLMADGTSGAQGSLPFLRLVHVSPVEHQRRLFLGMRGGPTRALPTGWIWERVPGARVEFRGEPGDECEVRVAVEFPAAQHTLEWVGRATVTAGGRAFVRVPYATGGSATARWRMTPAGQRGLAEHLQGADGAGGRAVGSRGGRANGRAGRGPLRSGPAPAGFPGPQAEAMNRIRTKRIGKTYFMAWGLGGMQRISARIRRGNQLSLPTGTPGGG